MVLFKGVPILATDGNFLTLMVTFKGVPMETIVQKELPQLDPTSIYACQEAASMDKCCMLIWVDQILGPYLVMNPPPPGVQPVILLDSYQCHMMASVVSKISALGVEVIHIPDRCTGLCQLLDVGNRPFKSCIQRLWEEWMMDSIDRYDEIRAPLCEDVSAWAAETHWEMQGLPLMRHAWRKTDYSWFTDDDLSCLKSTLIYNLILDTV